MTEIKKIFKWFNWASVVPVVKEAFARFTLPFIAVLASTMISLLLIHGIDFISRDFMHKCLTSMLYAVVALTSLKLLVESQKLSLVVHAVSAIIVSTIIMSFVWLVFDESIVATYFLLSVAILLSLLFSPYINKQSTSASVWYFNYQTGVAVFFGAVAAVVLGIGVSLVLVSIRYLFEIKIADEIYADIWVLSWGILFPVYVLYNMSKEFEFEEEACGFPRGVSFIANYILVPLMFVYLAILYAYFLKIVVQWELPRGNLGWMITAFGSVGIVTKLLAYPIRNKGTRLLALFDRYYYYALLLPVVLLAIAISIRINEHGVTEQRYAVVLLGVWFAIVALVAVFRKDRFNIKYVPAILATLAFFSSFGPWGAVEISTNSQINRFEKILLKHDLLADGQAVRSTRELPIEDRRTLSSIADYLAKTESRLTHIRPWFKTLNSGPNKIEITSHSWQGGKNIVELMGVSYTTRSRYYDDAEHFEYSRHFDFNKLLVDVSEFDYVSRGNLYLAAKSDNDVKMKIQNKSDKQQITFGRFSGHYLIKSNEDDNIEFDIDGLILELRQQNINSIVPANLDKIILTRNSANGRLRARLILEEIRGTIEEKKTVRVTDLRYILMIKFLNP